MADLGTPQQIRDLDLTQGELVAVYGRSGRINKRPVIVADFAADVERISRGGGQEQAQQAGARQTSEPRQERESSAGEQGN